MKLLICSSLIFLISISVNSQVFEFKNSSDYHEQPSGLHNIGEYLYYSFNISDSTDIYRHTFYTGALTNEFSFYKMFKTDLNGNLIDSLVFSIDSGLVAYNSYKGFNNRLYLISYNEYDTNNSDRINIIRVNQNLEIEFNKNIQIANSDYVGSYIAYVKEFEFVISINYKLDNDFHTLIYRLDENVNTLQIINPQFHSLWYFERIPGETNYLGGTPLQIVKLDNNFNIIWQKFSEVLPELCTRTFWNNDNSEAVIIAQRLVETHMQVRVSLNRSDSSFNFPYDQVVHYGYNNYQCNLGRNTVIKSDEHGYFIGTYPHFGLNPYFSNNTSGQFTIRNYSEDLELIWDRTFGIGGDSTYTLSDLIDVGDGLILSGWKYCPTDLEPNCDVFLYKFDYNGNFYKIFERPATLKTAKVFPNPGNDYFDLSMKSDYQNAKLKLFNIKGQLVLEHEIQDKQERINTQYIPPGIYTYSINKENKQIYSGKWVKE